MLGLGMHFLWIVEVKNFFKNAPCVGYNTFAFARATFLLVVGAL